MSSNPFAPTFQAPGQDAPTAVQVTPAPGTGPFLAWPDADTLRERARESVPESAASAQETPRQTIAEWSSTTLAAAVEKGRERNRAGAAPATQESQPEPEDPAAVPETMTATDDPARRGQPGVMYVPAQESQPEPEDPAPPARKPDGRSSDKARATRRRLSQAEAREVRVRFQYRRELANDPDSPEDWETVSDTESDLAREYGISRSSITNVVTGQTYPDAGGPIDHHRAARRELYEREAVQYGPEVARSRLMSYRDTGQALPASITVTVQEPGKDPRTFTYPAGTAVTVATVLDGQDV